MAQRPIRLSDDMYEATAHIAKLEHRSHANQVDMMLTLAISHYDELIEMDRKEKIMVRDHIVKEGRELGLLPKTPTPPKNTPEKKSSEPDGSGVSPVSDVSDLISSPAETAVVPDLEHECCKNEFQPCKHWVWDAQTGDGYRNILSGRLMEVE